MPKRQKLEVKTKFIKRIPKEEKRKKFFEIYNLLIFNDKKQVKNN